jgi:hypothetical protein
MLNIGLFNEKKEHSEQRGARKREHSIGYVWVITYSLHFFGSCGKLSFSVLNSF